MDLPITATISPRVKVTERDVVFLDQSGEEVVSSA